jgi:hypothetical protein
MDEDQLRILDEVPSSAVELQVKEKVCTQSQYLINFWVTNFQIVFIAVLKKAQSPRKSGRRGEVSPKTALCSKESQQRTI